jgi:YegS/Rv2252/BmrU family lipid kinase
MAMYERIRVIVNPAAGQGQPALDLLENVFRAAGAAWDCCVVEQGGDARALAEEAVAAGVEAIAVYGGDGTVSAVASALRGSGVPMAIFPGGTANVMSIELGIPGDLAEAAALVCGGAGMTRTVDMGELEQGAFLLRAGVGFEAQMVEGAGALKERVGTLAYTLAALQALREPKVSRYRLTLDGQEVESEGLTCIIANSGSLGVPGLTFAPTILVDDGLLDVIVLRQADLGSLLSLLASVLRGDENAAPLQHWQAREINVVADPPQSVQVDGEMQGTTPLHARIHPRAVEIIVPKPPA